MTAGHPGETRVRSDFLAELVRHSANDAHVRRAAEADELASRSHEE
jgi:hypothetical protein